MLGAPALCTAANARSLLAGCSLLVASTQLNFHTGLAQPKARHNHSSCTSIPSNCRQHG
jgi:hypothetical protein